MKILFINTLYYPNFVGGAEKSIQVLAENLVSDGNDVVVISTNSKSYIDKINGVKVYYENPKNLYWSSEDRKNNTILEKFIWHGLDAYNIRIKERIGAILDQENPDVVHTNNLSGISVLAWKIAKNKGFKVVHTIRDYYLICPKTTMFKNNTNCKNQCLDCRIFSFSKKKLSNYVDAVVGVSNFVLEKHLRLGYFSTDVLTKVIGNEIVINPSPKKRFDLKKVSFGYLGRLTESKGIEYLLSIFSNLSGVDNWELIVAGKGEAEYENELKIKYNNLRIKFVGVVNSDEFYNNIDVLIVPSLWHEPFGRVIIEGIKHKKIVIASKRGGIQELTGLSHLFDPDKKDDLENLVLSVLKNQTLSELNYEYKNNITNQYFELYKSIL